MTGEVGQSATIMAYYVYILASRKDGATYVGITNDLVRRLYEHRQKSVPGFTKDQTWNLEIPGSCFGRPGLTLQKPTPSLP